MSVNPQPLPQHYFELYLQMQRNMEIVTGINDITQDVGQSHYSGHCHFSLQEASQARIRDKAKNLEDSIRRLGTLMLSRITRFYTPERAFRLRGGTASFVRVIRFSTSGGGA